MALFNISEIFFIHVFSISTITVTKNMYRRAATVLLASHGHVYEPEIGAMSKIGFQNCPPTLQMLPSFILPHEKGC